MKLVTAVNDKREKKVEKLDEKLFRQFASCVAGNVCPMQAIIGGIAAQEVMKVSCFFWSLVLF